LRVEQCTACGADLRTVPQTVIGSSQVIELPPVRPVVIEAHRYAVDCPVCGQPQSADYPMGLEPERVFGPRLEAGAHYLHRAHPLSYVRTQDIVRSLFGLDVSLGALVNVVKRASGTFHAAARAHALMGRPPGCGRFRPRPARTPPSNRRGARSCWKP
jgi:transposase